MHDSLQSWWSFLCVAAALNVCAWLASAALLRRGSPDLPERARALRRTQLLLSAGYVFGCAFRSVLPVFDVPRLCLVDSWLSSVVVGRSVATVAELCFVAQWALILREVARATHASFARRAAALIVPLIAVAETCSWVAVLTTANLGHVIEESLWGLSALLFVLGVLETRPRCPPWLHGRLLLWGAAGLAYTVFMFGVDVPMYWSRWIADEHVGRAYLSLTQGLVDASTRWVVSHRWEDWRSEVVWMSLYFSVAVWFSIALVHTRLPARVRRGRRALRPSAGPQG